MGKGVTMACCTTLLWLLSIHSIISGLQAGELVGGCIASERTTLLAFKAGIEPLNISEYGYWQDDEDCCKWPGVSCNNETGNVMALTLQNFGLSGEISPSILSLTHLAHFDLSQNNFNGAHIPEFFGSLENLIYLNLSFAGFRGRIPPQLGNLSHIRYLDLNSLLSSDIFYLDANSPHYETYVDNLGWLSHLSSLEYLDMSGVTLTGKVDWLHTVIMLPNLKVLRLVHCGLPALPTTLPKVNFTSLITLDLSLNDFSSGPPKWLLSLGSLKMLNLAFNSLHGPFPDALGHISSLASLNLAENMLNGTIPKSFAKLCNLTELDVSENNIIGDISHLMQLLQCTWNRLQILRLAGNSLTGNLNSWIEQMASLQVLDISSNKLNGSIPAGIGKLFQLTHLDVAANNLNGFIPVGIGKLSQLTHLDAGSNNLNGSIPVGIGKLSQLTQLDLGSNNLDGSIPVGIGKLSQLTHLDLGYNSFDGTVSEAHFANLTRLDVLSLSMNSLTISLPENWVPPFDLNSIELRSCQLGPRFPTWLRFLTNVTVIDLWNSSISDRLPDWLSMAFPRLSYLDLSTNNITGTLPMSLGTNCEYCELFLNSNRLEGQISPRLLENLDTLDVSNNFISGPLPQIEAAQYLAILLVSNNHISSRIPSFLCNSSRLWYLDLSKNHFNGEIPDCWTGSALLVIDLANNNLSGGFPTSLCSLSQLEALYLSNNSLSGSLPTSWNCTELHLLDLGQNNFVGNIPAQLGDKLTSLVILRLRSNMFSGDIPQELGKLDQLQVLDLADNNLSGSIPKSFKNFRSMVVVSPRSSVYALNTYYGRTSTVSSVVEVIKGEELTYTKNLQLLTSMDLSNNNLIGEIPTELEALIGLRSLNLSVNHLQGPIPPNIGNLQQLESLDLSRNELSGRIPPSISNLTFLNHLNLSYNHLSGRIPSGQQIQVLNDPTIYEGNNDLCGAVIAKQCPSNETFHGTNYQEPEEDEDMAWLFLSMGLGFALGLCSLCGALLLKREWSYAYFQFIDNLYDRLYVVVAVRVAKHRRGNQERD